MVKIDEQELRMLLFEVNHVGLNGIKIIEVDFNNREDGTSGILVKFENTRISKKHGVHINA